MMVRTFWSTNWYVPNQKVDQKTDRNLDSCYFFKSGKTAKMHVFVWGLNVFLWFFPEAFQSKEHSSNMSVDQGMDRILDFRFLLKREIHAKLHVFVWPRIFLKFFCFPHFSHFFKGKTRNARSKNRNSIFHEAFQSKEHSSTRL